MNIGRYIHVSTGIEQNGRVSVVSISTTAACKYVLVVVPRDTPCWSCGLFQSGNNCVV